MRTAQACTTQLEGLDVECTHCSIRMTAHTGSGGQIRYFHCPSCQRWASSSYQEVFRADAKLRTREHVEPKSTFEAVKDRLDRWLRSLDHQDPYRALGCSPFDSDETIRLKYRALARQHHPDRGGNIETMRAINEAWERVTKHREQRKRQALEASNPITA